MRVRRFVTLIYHFPKNYITPVVMYEKPSQGARQNLFSIQNSTDCSNYTCATNSRMDFHFTETEKD